MWYLKDSFLWYLKHWTYEYPEIFRLWKLLRMLWKDISLISGTNCGTSISRPESYYFAICKTKVTKEKLSTHAVTQCRWRKKVLSVTMLGRLLHEFNVGGMLQKRSRAQWNNSSDNENENFSNDKWCGNHLFKWQMIEDLNQIQNPPFRQLPLANGTSLVRNMNIVYGKPSTQKPYIHPYCKHSPTNLRPTSFTTIVPYIEPGKGRDDDAVLHLHPYFERTADGICNWAPTKTFLLPTTAALHYVHSNWTTYKEPPSRIIPVK